MISGTQNRALVLRIAIEATVPSTLVIIWQVPCLLLGTEDRAVTDLGFELI